MFIIMVINIVIFNIIFSSFTLVRIIIIILIFIIIFSSFLLVRIIIIVFIIIIIVIVLTNIIVIVLLLLLLVIGMASCFSSMSTGVTFFTKFNSPIIICPGSFMSLHPLFIIVMCCS